MDAKIKNRLKRTGLLCAVALVIGGIMGFMEMRAENLPAAMESMVTADIGGPLTLLNHDGQTPKDKDFAGKYMMIYFGFASCADTCPTELAKISDVIKRLGPLGDEIQPIFVSVDPKRDTPQVLKTYVASFNPRLIGLTGTQDQVN